MKLCTPLGHFSGRCATVEGMAVIPSPASERSLLDRFTPRANQRTRLAGAVVTWTVGTAILLVRGVLFLHDEHWALWLIALAVGIGVVKSQMVLDRVARKAVARMRERERACFFGFFSPKTWIFVALMMGGGIMLRRSGLHHGVLAVLYIGVGTALVIANRIFWRALFEPMPPVGLGLGEPPHVR